MALGAADTTTAAATLKYIYRKKGLETILYKQSPVLGMITKINDFTGNGTLFHTVQHGGQQGVSLDLTSAISNQSSSIFKQFALSRANVYGTGKIAGTLIRASKDDNGSLLRALKNEQNNVLLGMQRHMSNFLYGNGGGAFGQVASFTGTTITLADPTQAIWFEVDQSLQHATTDGTSGALADAAAVIVVTKVDRRQGIIYATTGGWATLANNDYIFCRGNFGQTNTVPMGLAGWIPLTDPTSTPFFGIDRTVDMSRLGGLRYLASAGGAIEEVLINAMAFFYQEGATPDTLVMNPVDVQKLMVALQSKATGPIPTSTRKAVNAAGDEIDIGYEAIRLVTPFGKVEVFADAACQINRAYFLDMSTWELHWMGNEFPMFLEEDGLMMLRSTTADQFEWRMAAHYNVLCTKPGGNGVAQLQLERG